MCPNKNKIHEWTKLPTSFWTERDWGTLDGASQEVSLPDTDPSSQTMLPHAFWSLRSNASRYNFHYIMILAS